MSYDISLVDPVTRKTLELDEPHPMRGGTFCPGGTTEAALIVTYNYDRHFKRVLPKHNDAPVSEFHRIFSDVSEVSKAGLRSLYGMTGAESIPVLDIAIAQLGDDVDRNYWMPTEGNAKRALELLRALALLRPDGVWDGN